MITIFSFSIINLRYKLQSKRNWIYLLNSIRHLFHCHTVLYCIIVQWIGESLIWITHNVLPSWMRPIKAHWDWQHSSFSSLVIKSLWYHCGKHVVFHHGAQLSVIQNLLSSRVREQAGKIARHNLFFLVQYRREEQYTKTTRHMGCVQNHSLITHSWIPIHYIQVIHAIVSSKLRFRTLANRRHIGSSLITVRWKFSYLQIREQCNVGHAAYTRFFIPL